MNFYLKIDVLYKNIPYDFQVQKGSFLDVVPCFKISEVEGTVRFVRDFEVFVLNCWE